MKTNYLKILGNVLILLYLSSVPSFADNFHALKSFSFDKSVSVVTGNDTYIFCGTFGAGVYRIDKTNNDTDSYDNTIAIRLDYNSRVQKWIDYFQGRGKKY